MRIGQLARKYTINQDQVIQYLNKAQADLAPFHHNSKVSSDIEELVTAHFSALPKSTEEVKEEPIEEVLDEAEEQIIDAIEIVPDKKTEVDLQLELDPTLPSIHISAKEKEEEKSSDNSIDTDTLMQLLEADEASNNLNHITHIKASKKELSGLKVVGKIELPEPKNKLVVESKNQEKTPSAGAIKRPKSQQLSIEEKDKRRLKILAQKEQYDARQEKRIIKAENNKRRAKNKVRYEEKMQKVKAGRAIQKIPKEEAEPEISDRPQAAKPIAIFDWFWKLFNL